MMAWRGAEFSPESFLWRVEDRVAAITLNRLERKNPLTFESCAAKLKQRFKGN